METQTAVRKVKSFVKISICTLVCLGVTSVHAEYYLVKSGNNCGCPVYRKKPCRHIKRYKPRRRHHCRPRRIHRPRFRCPSPCPSGCDRYYVWQGAPCDCGVGCGGYWRRGGGCGGCGDWMPDAWANDYTYYNSGYIENYYYPVNNYDLTTSDDNPYINPNLQINY